MTIICKIFALLALLLSCLNSQAWAQDNFQVKGVGLGLGYSTLLQESQVELLTAVGASQRALSLHLGQSFWNYGGMRSNRMFEIEAQVYSCAAATRWFVLPESPIYFLAGGGVFSTRGELTSSYVDVELGHESQKTHFQMLGTFFYGHMGLAFDFLKHYYFDFAIRGFGKALPHHHTFREDPDSNASNTRLIYENFAAPKIYGLINLKLGVLF